MSAHAVWSVELNCNKYGALPTSCACLLCLCMTFRLAIFSCSAALPWT